MRDLTLYIKGLILIFVFMCGFLFAETALGGINLGDSYATVQKKYPDFPKWVLLIPGTNPFPISIEDKTRAFKAASKKLDIQCYFNNRKRVTAIVVFFYDKEDESLYETNAGLRPGDGLTELKILYGNPLDISEYVYFDQYNEKEVIRIYYYPGMCVHTRKLANVDELITSIVVGQYNTKAILGKKDAIIEPKKSNS